MEKEYRIVKGPAGVNPLLQKLQGKPYPGMRDFWIKCEEEGDIIRQVVIIDIFGLRRLRFSESTKGYWWRIQGLAQDHSEQEPHQFLATYRPMSWKKQDQFKGTKGRFKFLETKDSSH